MEVRSIAASDVKNLLTTLFSDEIEGFQTQDLDVRMLFNITSREYAPAYVLPAQAKNEKKYLIYSPLQMLVNVCDDLTFKDALTQKDVYHQGYLNAYVTEDGKGGVGINLFLDECEGTVCKSKENALALIKAKVAFTPSLQVDFFKFPIQEIYPCLIGKSIYWMMPHKNNLCFLVNVANSEVTYQCVQIEYITFIQEKGCYESQNPKSGLSEKYDFDGNKFSALM